MKLPKTPFVRRAELVHEIRKMLKPECNEIFGDFVEAISKAL